MELTDKEIHLLARLSRDRGLYAECKGADLDALQKLGLIEWFDTRSSTTPFKSASTAEIAVSVAGSIISGLDLQKIGASLSGKKFLLRSTRSTKSNGRSRTAPRVAGIELKAGRITR
jgi:hypothetical protein